MPGPAIFVNRSTDGGKSALVSPLSARLPGSHTLIRNRIPDWLVALILLLLPIRIFVSPSLHISPADWLVIASYPIFVATIVRLVLMKRLLAPSFIGIVSVILISLARSALSAGVSIYALVNKAVGVFYLIALYLFFAAYASQSSKSVANISRMTVLSALVHILVAIVGYFRRWHILFNDPCYPRLSGLTGAPVSLGIITTVSFFLAFSSIATKKPLLGRWTSVAAVICVGAMVLTYARGSYVGALAGVFMILLLLRPNRAKLVALALVVIGTGSVLSWVLAERVRSVDPRISLQELLRRPHTISARLEQYRFASETFFTNPFWGAGLGETRVALGTNVHNTYLWLAAESGIWGLLAAGALVLSFLVSGWRWFHESPPDDRFLAVGWLAGHIAFAVATAFSELLYHRHWWLIMSVLAAGRQSLKGGDRPHRRPSVNAWERAIEKGGKGDEPCMRM